MSGRKLNAVEQKIHQAALANNDKTLSNKELAALVSDQTERTAALNFLLGSGLLKPLQHSGGKLSFRAVVKQELEIKKDLSSEENLVFGHIQAAGNEGIWTKHLKVKTELHKTVIDRCLKSLTQKQLIKSLNGSVQHPTRKIYMLFHLEPSVEMTGGPWYTDKELDTEFIKLLSAACLKFIRDRSFPRAKSGETKQRLLYPISAAPGYPTAAQIQTFLNKSRITETQLSVEHVEMLLNVLIIDGEVEQIPALGAALWESSVGNDEDEDEESSEEERASKSKKRKRSDESGKRKKKRKKVETSDSESESDDERSSKHGKSKSKSKSKAKAKSKKSKKADSESESESESDSDSEDDKKKKRKKRKTRDTDDFDNSETQGTEEEDSPRKKSKSKKKTSKKRKARDDSSSSEESGSEDESPRRSRSKAKSKSRSRRDASPAAEYMMDDSMLLGGAHVYRAIYPERMLGFGLGQAPCGRCPTFDFCTEGGPVNAGDCLYYGDWLSTAEVKLE